MTYTALDQHGCDYTPVAEGVSVPSIDHLTEQTAEKRNILIEAARIGRGRIRDIREIDFEEYGALIIPGGLGLLNNYRNSERVKACMTHFVSSRKPIAAMCAGIDFLRRFPVYGLFDGEVVSCEEHTVKPEPRIYEILLERYGLTPSETLFIDDREMNIEAAAALGIHGFVFDHRDPDAACDALRRRLLQSDCI